MDCINRSDLKYQGLLKMSRLTELELDARVRPILKETGEFPYIEQIVKTDTSRDLIERLNLQKNGDSYSIPASSVENLKAKYGDNLSAYFNNLYRDLEITFKPMLDKKVEVEIKKRATVNRTLESPRSNIGTYTQHNDIIYPQPVEVFAGNYIYHKDSNYYVSPVKIANDLVLKSLNKFEDLKSARKSITIKPTTLVSQGHNEAINLVKNNLQALSQGQTVLVESRTKMPGKVTFFQDFNYPSFTVSTFIKGIYTNKNGKITVNPSIAMDKIKEHLGEPNTDKVLLKTLLRAENVLSDETINSVVENTNSSIKVEIAPYGNGKYAMRKLDGDSDINDITSISSNENPIDRIEAIIDRLSSLYDVKFNLINGQEIINNPQIRQFVPDASRVNAFVFNGEIFINTDNAKEDAPLHELAHLLLGSLKSTDNDLYNSMVESVHELPDYDKKLMKYPNRARVDVDEEIFIEEFTKHYLEANTDKLGIDPKTFNKAEYSIKRNLDSGIFPNKSLTNVPLKSIMGKNLTSIMSEFGTAINDGSLASGFRGNEAANNRKLANVKEDLLKQGLLKEYCE